MHFNQSKYLEKYLGDNMKCHLVFKSWKLVDNRDPLMSFNIREYSVNESV